MRDSLSAILVSGPSHGTFNLNANGSFAYTPALGFAALDAFGVARNSTGRESSPATVGITVNATPVANADAYATDEDTPMAVPLVSSVLANDSDSDLDVLSAIVATPPAHGVLVLNPNGSFDYTPAANFFGADSFTYRAQRRLARLAGRHGEHRRERRTRRTPDRERRRLHRLRE